VFGRDFKGGVVRAVLDRARALPINVGIVIQGDNALSDRLFAVVDPGPHGQAALELAARIAQRNDCPLHATVLLGHTDGGVVQPALAQMLADAAKLAGRRLHTEVLADLDGASLLQQNAGLVIAASNLAAQLEVSRSARGDGRTLVLVQGAQAQRPATVSGAEFPRSANSW
jgi:hypothetical protein